MQIQQTRTKKQKNRLIHKNKVTKKMHKKIHHYLGVGGDANVDASNNNLQNVLFPKKTITNIIQNKDPKVIIPDTNVLDLINKYIVSKISNDFTQVKNITHALFEKVFKITDPAYERIKKLLDVFLQKVDIKKLLTEARGNWVVFLNKLVINFNKTLINPIFKDEFAISIAVLSIYTKILAEAMKQPLKDSADVINDGFIYELNDLASSGVGILASAASSVPFLGSVIGLGETINDASQAVMSAINAGSILLEAAATLAGETSDNINNVFNNVEAQEKIADDIMSRTNKVLKEFDKPLEKLENKYNINNSANDKLKNIIDTEIDTKVIKELKDEIDRLKPKKGGGRMIQKIFHNINDQKYLSDNILNRTNETLHMFENPMQNVKP